jgi:hypothetical protein
MTEAEAYRAGQVIGALNILNAITDDIGPKRGSWIRKRDLMRFLEKSKDNVRAQGG